MGIILIPILYGSVRSGLCMILLKSTAGEKSITFGLRDRIASKNIRFSKNVCWGVAQVSFGCALHQLGRVMYYGVGKIVSIQPAKSHLWRKSMQSGSQPVPQSSSQASSQGRTSSKKAIKRSPPNRSDLKDQVSQIGRWKLVICVQLLSKSAKTMEGENMDYGAEFRQIYGGEKSWMVGGQVAYPLWLIVGCWLDWWAGCPSGWDLVVGWLAGWLTG